MFFTQEDFRKIEAYLKANSKKDTDFIPASLITDTDTVAIVLNGVNKSLNLSSFMDTIQNSIAEILEDLLNIHHVILSQAQYDALQVKDANTIYIIVERPNVWTFGNAFPVILS